MRYTDEMIDYIRKIAYGKSHAEITSEFNKKFNENVDSGRIKSLISRKKIITGRTGYFELGHIPYNKGKKGCYSAGSEKGWFKKGNIPAKTRSTGDERIDSKDGYILVKTESGKWKHKHRLIYEEKFGLIPKGYVVTFLDGNKQNVDINNLKLISRSENAVMNRNGLYSKDPKLTEIGNNIAKLKIAIGKRGKK